MLAEMLKSTHFTATVRIGRVSSVNKGAHRVAVQFEEIDGVVSWDLSVLVTHPGDYALPAANTPVLCLILDGRLGLGFVLGAIYTDNDAAPLDDDGQRSVAGDDLRLGDPNATDKVSLAPKCKSNFDAIKDEFTLIHTTLGSLTGSASFGTPYAQTYSATDPAAEKVKAK